MKTKQILVFFLILCSIFAFCGCSSSREESDAYSTTEKASKLVSERTTEKQTIVTTAAPKLLTWSDSELARMLPKPDSKYGEIKTDSSDIFAANIEQFSFDDFLNYEKACVEKGFSVDAKKEEKSYSAKNKNGDSLLISAGNDNSMSISLEAAKFNVEIELSCDENLIFSKYDIEVYLDDQWLGKIDHGTSRTFSETLKKGSYTLLFKNSEDSDVTGSAKFNVVSDVTLKYELHCTMIEISVTDLNKQPTTTKATDSSETKPQESSKTESKSEQGCLTIENNADFASLMSIEDTSDNTPIKAFIKSYKNATIKFDGCIAYMMPHGSYKTRFDVCMAGGNYSAERVYGPLFAFEDVNYSNINVSGADTVSQGMNFTITAKIEGFNDNGNYIILKPVELKAR